MVGQDEVAGHRGASNTMSFAPARAERFRRQALCRMADRLRCVRPRGVAVGPPRVMRSGKRPTAKRRPGAAGAVSRSDCQSRGASAARAAVRTGRDREQTLARSAAAVAQRHTGVVSRTDYGVRRCDNERRCKRGSERGEPPAGRAESQHASRTECRMIRLRPMADTATTRCD